MVDNWGEIDEEMSSTPISSSRAFIDANPIRMNPQKNLPIAKSKPEHIPKAGTPSALGLKHFRF